MSREHSTHVHITADEDYSCVHHAAEWLERILERKKIEPYNEQFVIRVTIDKLGDEEPADVEDSTEAS